MPRKLPNLPPLDTEDTLYLDKEDDMWCIFGSESGYCYASYASKEEAERFLLESIPQSKR